MAKQDSIQDNNHYPAAMFHSGTAGTADTIRWTGEASGAGHVHITGGTVVSGAPGDTPGGTLDLVTRVGNLGTLELGSVVVNTLPDLPGGTIDLVTRVGNLGTLELGSVAVTTIPQVSVGTVPQVSVGTVPNINVATGTQQTLGTVGVLNNGTLAQVTSVSNMVGGTITRVLGGTVNLLTDQNSLGTLGKVESGTVQKNEKPVNIGTSFHTRGTTGAAVWGTLIAASGAGTYQYVSNVDIVVTSGTVDVAVTNIGIGGSTGAGVLTRGQFTPGGGIAKNFDPIARSGTNGTLSYWLGGAGTVDINVTYWQAT